MLYPLLVDSHVRTDQFYIYVIGRVETYVKAMLEAVRLTGP